MAGVRASEKSVGFWVGLGRRMLRSARGFALGLACCVVVLAAAPARAQFDMSGMMRQQLVSKRSVEGYSKLLGFDKDQTETAMTLLDGFRAASEATIKDFRNQMQDLQNKAQNSGDWQGMQKDMASLGQKIQEKMQADEKQLFDDLKAICTPDQAAKWERVERMRRREQGLRMSFVSGQGLDLIAIAQRQKIDDKGEVKDLLNEYEVAIDKPLGELKRMQEDQGKRQKEMMDKMSKDPMAGMEAAKKMLGELAETGRTMRGINRDYARKIDAVLSDAERAKFDAEIARRSFPRVYKEPYALKLVAAAGELNDLTPDQKQTLAQIGRSYADEAKNLNDKWAKAIEAQEDKHNGAFGVMMDGAMSQFGGAGGADDTTKDVNEARDARKDLDEKTEKRVKDLLNADQQAKMPEKSVEPEMPWMQMMGGDEDATETNGEK